jgi:hypothetical protein
MSRFAIERFLIPAGLVLALAACSPMGERGGGPERGDGGERPRAGGAAFSGIDQVRLQLRDTAQALDLTPKQVPLWEAYQDKVGALINDLHRIEPYRPPRQGAVRQIGAKVDQARNRLAALEEVQEAADRLYQSLDEKQRQIADQRLSGTVPALYACPAGGGAEGGGEMPRGGGPGRGGMGGAGGGMGGMRGPGGGF